MQRLRLNRGLRQRSDLLIEAKLRERATSLTLKERSFSAMAGRSKHFLVAVIDDDAGVRKAIQNMLSAEGFQTRGFESAEEFLRSRNGRHAGCVILDMQLPGMSGLALHRDLQARGSRIAVIFVTASQPSAQLLRAGALAVLSKPFDPAELRRIVRGVFDTHRSA